jgi:hypothetical protein
VTRGSFRCLLRELKPRPAEAEAFRREALRRRDAAAVALVAQEKSDGAGTWEGSLQREAGSEEGRRISMAAGRKLFVDNFFLFKASLLCLKKKTVC